METMHAAGRRTLPPVPRPSIARAAPGEQPEPAGQDCEAPTERFVVDLTTDERRTESIGTATTPRADAPADDAPAAEPPADDAPAAEPPADAPADDVADDVADAPADHEAATPADDEAEAADRAHDEAHDEAHDQAHAATAPAVGDASRAETLDPGKHFVAGLRAAAADFAEAAGAESSVVREAVPPARHRRARCRLVLRYADDAEVDVTFLGPAGRPGMPSRHGLDRQILRWLTAGQLRDDAWLVTDPEASDGFAVDLSAWVAAA